MSRLRRLTKEYRDVQAAQGPLGVLSCGNALFGAIKPEDESKLTAWTMAC